MEKKQLNLNAPFYSVRRFSPSSHSCELTKPKSTKDKPFLPPLHKNSGQENDVVALSTKPASVPFQWEQTPGRPKPDGSPRPPPNSSASVRFFSGEIPRPPPGRLLSSGPSRLTSAEFPKPPLARLLSSATSRHTSGDHHHHHSLYKPQVEGFSFADHASLVEKLRESLKCNREDESNDGDAYSDALDDELSLSGGSDGSRAATAAKLSRTFSVDKNTRDMMMDRFLPAAKAAVLETNAKRQQQQQPPKTAEKKKVSGEVKKPIPAVKKPIFKGTLPYYIASPNYVNNQESEEDDDESLRMPTKKSGKRWGIIPRFCVNPLPALKSKPRPQTPAFSQVRRLARNALSGPLDKIIRPEPPQKKKSHSGLLFRELPPRMDANRRSNSGQFPNPSRDSYSLSLSPLRRYRSGNSSPCRNEFSKSPSYQGSGFYPLPDKLDKNRNNPSYNYKNNKNEHFDDCKLASSRKLFKALQDVSKNQKSGKPNDKVESNFESVESEFVMCKSPLPPPLPKSPSEPWLWRTLPSLGNPFSGSNRKSPARRNKNDRMDSSVDSKWETIVKSSNLHRGRFLYSQELTPRLSHSRKLAKETL